MFDRRLLQTGDADDAVILQDRSVFSEVLGEGLAIQLPELWLYTQGRGQIGAEPLRAQACLAIARRRVYVIGIWGLIWVRRRVVLVLAGTCFHAYK